MITATTGCCSSPHCGLLNTLLLAGSIHFQSYGLQIIWLDWWMVHQLRWQQPVDFLSSISSFLSDDHHHRGKSSLVPLDVIMRKWKTIFRLRRWPLVVVVADDEHRCLVVKDRIADRHCRVSKNSAARVKGKKTKTISRGKWNDI